MKKLTFLVTNKEYDTFIDEIRELGVVHIDELQAGKTSPEFEAAMEIDKRYQAALATLDFAKENYETEKEFSAVKLDAVQDIAKNAQEVLEKIESLAAREIELKHDLDENEKLTAKLEPWGDFDLSLVKQLRRTGFKPFFWMCPKKMYKKEWEDDYFATIVNDENNKYYFITFSDTKPELTAEEVDFPDDNLSQLIEKKKELKKNVEDLHEELLKINAEQRNLLEAGRLENENSLSLSKVHLSFEAVADNQLRLMVGWIPEDKQQVVCKYLDDNKIFYEQEDPTLEDKVPIEIKNGKYSSLFEPILKMYSLPRYADLDITAFFAPFFMLFFGLCLGDAGYGLIILAACIYYFFKADGDGKKLAKLGIWLGGTTVVCGFFTGTFFGIDLSQQSWAFLAPVKDLFFNEKNWKLLDLDYPPMMVVSIIIGLVQVLLGMTLAASKAAKNYGWKFAIGKMSWVIAIITAIITFGLPAFGVQLHPVVQYVLYGILILCLIGIFFLNSPNKNIVVNFGTGIWDTYGMATGLLGDLLSYIRLFALGLTGGVLGGVFNTLAIDLTASMSWTTRWLPMFLILLIGHVINFGLCLISSFVHPMRLTFVEFFKNANFEGGGKEYAPFKVKSYKEK